ncbi:hypothetical protein N7478_008428 [Penicillium angulare]|uniref:uncharacterized protein n=1 Tax=Penicillium angulare TaxID=116970 RepID=UPI00254204BF|nr:uncharacterized protein N7478_008428 [Penicillium angulare]KAJ5273303.1 hypothetical protein N7478_008428 [Penicillium angulare]
MFRKLRRCLFDILLASGICYGTHTRRSNLWRHVVKVAFLIILWLLLVAAVVYYEVREDINGQLSPGPRENKNEAANGRLRASNIPRKIWQMYLTPPDRDASESNFKVDTKNLEDTVSWLAHNVDYEYCLVGNEKYEKIVDRHFKRDQSSRAIFKTLGNYGMKSDLFRYLILFEEGGVYSDIDTINLKSVELWIPEKYRKDARILIGIEFDRLDGGDWSEVHSDLQFCQWTIAAAPGHILFKHMIQWSLSALNKYAVDKGIAFTDMKVSSSEVMRLTGPAAWTDAVFRQLQYYDDELTTLRNLSGLSEPRLIGDILILPIDGFGMGQSHSNSTHDGSIPEGALVQHGFRGLWKHESKKRYVT